MLIDLINNIALLITLSALYGVLIRIRQKNPTIFKYAIGVWFGLIAVAEIMMPFVFQPGIIYDTRSIILSLAGLFGGGIPAFIATAIAGTYRIYIGGPGIWAGLATIILSASVGFIFRIYYNFKPEKISILSLWLIGVVVHLIMLLCQLLAPWQLSLPALKLIATPVMLLFPIAFVMAGRLLGYIEGREQAFKEVSEAESLYRATIYSIGDAVITTDRDGLVKQMNPEAERITGWKETETRGKPIESVFKIMNELTGERVESPVKDILLNGKIIGLANNTMLISKDGTPVPITDSGAPIININGEIAGVVVVFRDLSNERAQRELIEKSEIKYRELVETTDAIAWEYDLVEKKWNYIAPQLTQKLGWLPDEWIQLDFWKEIIHPDDREKTATFLQEAITNQVSQTVEYRIKTKEGIYCWISNFASVEKVGEKPLKARGFMIDINNRKLVEIELREKNSFIQIVLDSLPIGVALNKIDEGTAFYMNHKFQEIYGWSAEEINNVSSFFEKVYPNEAYRNEIMTRIIEDIYSGISENLKWDNIIVTRKDGTTATVNAVNIPLYDQNIMVSTVMDITPQKEAEALLRKSEEKFRKLFENHSVVHLLINPENGHIVNANAAASKFYGYSIDQLKGMPLTSLNTLSPDKIQEAMQITKNTGQGFYEFKHRLANGVIRDVEVFSSVINLEETDYLYSIIHDITDKKQLFEEVIKAKEKAEENDRLKSAFLANMSHEIRTPLNGILGFTGLLTGDKDLTEEKRERFSSIINRSAESLMQIINDILDLSKLETDQLNLSKVTFNLNDNLESLFTLFKKKIEDRSKNEVQLRLLCPSEIIYLDQDINRLNQIFINLLDNAIKFTKTGSISFGVTGIEDGRIYFAVSDTGIGIAKEKHKLIFDRFAQADENTSKIYGGTGLGLSIVKKLIQIMGGEITVSSEKGKGAQFLFNLPYDINIRPVIEKSIKKHELPDSKNINLLLIEDDPMSVLFYQEILKYPAFNLQVAQNGRTALQLLNSFTFDVILLDLGLPDMNGLDIAKEIRKTDRNVKIIAQTAFAMQSDEEKTIEAGCNDYISKPINTNALMKKLLGK